jgi:uncharacterized MAPEG superfamily protein
MTTPLWTLLVATLLPYVWFSFANPLRKKEFGSIDNNHPRIQEAKQTGMGARAMAASANAFEALAMYTPAVLVAHVMAPTASLAPILALVWVVARVLHGIAYITDKPGPRSACFGIGALCSLGLFLVGAGVL